MKSVSRRTAIKAALAGSAALAGNHLLASVDRTEQNQQATGPLKGNIHHSVSKWCFGDYALDEFCKICKKIGIESVELLGPKDWPVVKSNGLTVAMAQGEGLEIDRGFNDPRLHDELVEKYEK